MGSGKKTEKETPKATKATKGPKGLLTVEKVTPIPPELKEGFDSIDGNDGLAYMKFLSSNALEGRETGSVGYQAAAEFAAALFESWGLKPAGDQPTPSHSHRRPPSSQSKKQSSPQGAIYSKYHSKST